MQPKPTHRHSRTALTLMAAAAVMPIVVTPADAQSSNQILKRNRRTDDGRVRAVEDTGPSYAPQTQSYGSMSSLAQQEMIRRQDKVRQADEALLEGRRAYAEGDYEKAVQEYRRALDILPDVSSVTSEKN